MTLAAVIFDMDGVLTATVEHHYQSWKKVTGEYDIPFSRKDNDKLRGLTRRRSLEVILGGRTLQEEEMQEILRRKNEYYLESVARLGPDDLLPGVARLLEELSRADLRLAVASASRNTRAVLSRLGILQYMDVICDGNSVQRSKPAPDVYLQAASGLQVKPASCLAVEDSPHGISAARVAGMCVVGVGPEEDLAGADAVFEDLGKVRLQTLREIHARWVTQRSQAVRRVIHRFTLPIETGMI